MSHCWGVPRGGAEELQCLKKNVASLLASCQQAVRAATAAAAASPEAPAPKAKSAAEPKSGAATTEPVPSSLPSATAEAVAPPASPEAAGQTQDAPAKAASAARTAPSAPSSKRRPGPRTALLSGSRAEPRRPRRRVCRDDGRGAAFVGAVHSTAQEIDPDPQLSERLPHPLPGRGRRRRAGRRLSADTVASLTS